MIQSRLPRWPDELSDDGWRIPVSAVGDAEPFDPRPEPTLLGRLMTHIRKAIAHVRLR